MKWTFLGPPVQSRVGHSRPSRMGSAIVPAPPPASGSGGWHPDPEDPRCTSEVELVREDPETARRFPKELYIINAASIRKHLYAKMTLAPDEKVIIGKSLTNVSGM